MTGHIRRRRALVVGVDQYAGPFETLWYAVHDAHDLAGLLRARGGFDVTLLTDREATVDAVQAALRACLDDAPDLALLAFFCHAVQSGPATWLVAHDGSLITPGVRFADLAARTAASRARDTVTVLDCIVGADIDVQPGALFARAFGEGPEGRHVLAATATRSRTLASHSHVHGDLAASLLPEVTAHTGAVTLADVATWMEEHARREGTQAPFVHLRGRGDVELLGPAAGAPSSPIGELTAADRAWLERIRVDDGPVIGAENVVCAAARLMYDALRTPGATLRIMGDGVRDDPAAWRSPESPVGLMARVHRAVMDSSVDFTRVQLARSTTTAFLREFVLRPARELAQAGRAARLANKRVAFNETRGSDLSIVLSNCREQAGGVAPTAPELPARGLLALTSVRAAGPDANAGRAIHHAAWVTSDPEALAYLARFVAQVAREGHESLRPFLTDAMVPCGEDGTVAASDLGALELVLTRVVQHNAMTARQAAQHGIARGIGDSRTTLGAHADPELAERLLQLWNRLDITWPGEVARELLATEPRRGPTRADLQRFAREGRTPWDCVWVFGAPEALRADPDRVKVTMIVGRVHGDETEGEHAIRRLMSDVEAGRTPVREGLLVLVVGNPATDHRASDPVWADLNRQFGDLPPRAVWHYPTYYEVRRAEVLRGIVPLVHHLLDMHASSVPTPPFVVTTERDGAVRAASTWGLHAGYRHYTYRWPKVLGGRILTDFAHLRHGVDAVGAECGMKRTESSRRYAEAGVRAFAALHARCGDAPPEPPDAGAALVFEMTEVVGSPSSRFEFKPRVGFELVRAGESMGRSPGGGVQMIAEKPRHIVLPMNRYARLDEDPVFGFWARPDTYPQALAVARRVATSDIPRERVREIAHKCGLHFEPGPAPPGRPHEREIAEMLAEEKHENARAVRDFFNELAMLDARVLGALDDVKTLLEE